MLPELSPSQLERLAILAEECGEVIQIIGKIQRHGYESRHPNGGETNRELLAKEIGDVITAAELLCVAEDASAEAVIDQCKAKVIRLKQYTHHQPAEIFNRMFKL